MNENELFQWALKQIADAQGGKLYGSITFKFENGKITSSKKEQTNKPVAIKTKNM